MGVPPVCPLLNEDKRRELGVNKVPHRCKEPYCPLSKDVRGKVCPWYIGCKRRYIQKSFYK